MDRVNPGATQYAIFSTSFVIVAGVTLILSASDSDDPRDNGQRIREATELFEKFVRFGLAFDTRIADLYADDAAITNVRKYPDGRTRKSTFAGRQYKPLIRLSMPLAKARGDKNRFSDVTYAIEDAGVRIRATRYSELKDYSSPMEWFVRPTEKGNWLIAEEKSESRP